MGELFVVLGLAVTAVGSIIAAIAGRARSRRTEREESARLATQQLLDESAEYRVELRADLAAARVRIRELEDQLARLRRRSGP